MLTFCRSNEIRCAVFCSLGSSFTAAESSGEPEKKK
jgi:hypothetical protein